MIKKATNPSVGATNSQWVLYDIWNFKDKKEEKTHLSRLGWIWFGYLVRKKSTFKRFKKEKLIEILTVCKIQKFWFGQLILDINKEHTKFQISSLSRTGFRKILFGLVLLFFKSQNIRILRRYLTQQRLKLRRNLIRNSNRITY